MTGLSGFTLGQGGDEPLRRRCRVAFERRAVLSPFVELAIRMTRRRHDRLRAGGKAAQLAAVVEGENLDGQRGTWRDREEKATAAAWRGELQCRWNFAFAESGQLLFAGVAVDVEADHARHLAKHDADVGVGLVVEGCLNVGSL